ncbi:unnamed protein product, partial [Symbiodinium microadriaticum]
PLPCPANDTILLELDGSSSNYSLQAEKVHDENTTVECSSVNSDWQQNLQVPGEVMCRYGLLAYVSVGWLNASLNPDTEAQSSIHDCYKSATAVANAVASTSGAARAARFAAAPDMMWVWTLRSFEGYSGYSMYAVVNPTNLSKYFGRYISNQSMIEAMRGGQYASETAAVGNYSVVRCLSCGWFLLEYPTCAMYQNDFLLIKQMLPLVLGPSNTVASGGTWEVAARPRRFGVVDAESADEGLRGVDNQCVERHCPAGTSLTVSKAGYTGTVVMSADIAHAAVGTASCTDVDEVATKAFSTGSCDDDNDLSWQQSWRVVALRDASSGNLALTCDWGVVSVDTLAFIAGTPFDVAPPQDILDGRNFSIPCVDLMAGYNGNARSLAHAAEGFTITLYDKTELVNLTADRSSGNPIAFLDPRTDTEASVAIGEQAAPGHDGSFSVLCSGGVLHPDLTTCTEPHGGNECVAATHLQLQLRPKPCAAGTMADFALGGATAELAFMEHLGVASFDCAAVNPDFHGTFEATCAFGNITGATSTCVENPCTSSSYVEAELGGTTSQQHSPGVLHGATWTVPCEPINWDYIGDMQMSCYRGHVRADNSSCILVELGCQPSGPGGNLTVGNYTVDLLPDVGVSKDETFQVDCGSQTQRKYVGEITVTCGRRGSYASVESGCEPRSCVGGEALLVQSQYMNGSLLSSDMAHMQAINVTCENVSEVLRGDVQITCDYGDFHLMHSCYSVCLPSRPAQATLGGTVHDVIAPEVLASGRGYFLPCNDFVANYSGTAWTSEVAS